MSAKFGPRNVQKRILNRPLTVGEFLNVMGQFERQTERKIWDALPWYKKVFRKLRRRYHRNAARRATASKTGQHPANEGERTSQGDASRGSAEG